MVRANKSQLATKSWGGILESYSNDKNYLSEKTRQRYSRTIKRFLNGLSASYGIGGITSTQIMEYLRPYRAGSSVTLDNNIAAIKSFMVWAADHFKLAENPIALFSMIGKTRKERSLKSRLNVDSWEDVLDQYYNYHEHFSAETRKLYGWTIRRFLNSLPESCDIGGISSAHILQYLQPYRGGASATWNTNLAAIKSFMTWAVGYYRLPGNPSIPLNPIPLGQVPNVRVLVGSEVELLQAKKDLNCQIAVFLCNTGLRASEFCSLRGATVNIDRKVIHVFGKGAKPRYVPLNKTALDVLTSYGSIFSPQNKPMSRQSLGKRMHHAAEAVKIEQFGPHACRHYFATELLTRGMPIQDVTRLIGHANIQMTFNRYYHPGSYGDLSILDSLS